MDFTGFLGNDAVKARLSGAFASGRVAHSYLICGPVGSGKHTLTRILCAAMQCEGRGEKIPCGVCSGCRKALEGVHPDIITVDDPEHKSMTVEPIRAARSDMFIRPNEGKRKIYIIPRGQDMNESAQNALLKILEEPPDYGVFLILSTNAERLLPTIRSRCAELQLGPVEQHEALPFLRQRMPDKPDGILRAAYLRAGGFLGQVLTLLQDAEDEPFVRQFAAAYAARDRMALLRILLPMEKAKREQLLPALQQLRACICGALAQRGGLDAASESAAQIVASRSGSELMQASDSIQTAIDALMANASAGAFVGYLTMKLRLAPNLKFYLAAGPAADWREPCKNRIPIPFWSSRQLHQNRKIRCRSQRLIYSSLHRPPRLQRRKRPPNRRSLPPLPWWTSASAIMQNPIISTLPD